MDIPRFDQRLGTSSSSGDLGDAFQTFVHELLLADYPGLHPFQSRGKDGGVDLSLTDDGLRTVVECKYIGKDGLEEARARWGQVAAKLREHLTDPDGPTRGQSQYRPWYRDDPPVREYIFCISSELGNLAQTDELRLEIEGFFAGLSAARTHLAHLSGLAVKVLDWNDIKTLLLKRPHLLFRWFKLTRDYGLLTLDERRDYSTFRSYLFSDKLPFYSRGRHLYAVAPPPGAEVSDEKGLLDKLTGGGLTGLVLTGSGGVGKTRLTLEIGWLAQSEEWVVLRVQRRLKEDALEHLARLVPPETRVLLLIDYVETQRDFAELIETLNDLNDGLGLRLRYVANCRTSYYQTIAATSRHAEVNLTPAFEDEAVREWFESYQRGAVRHILESSRIEVTERHLRVCRDVPVLAVFVSYLHDTGRGDQLEQLLTEEDFTRWLVKRLQLTFGDATVSQSLAQLVALFPMPADTARRPELAEHGELFNRLAADGWVERLPADETHEYEVWVTAHDVLADRILLSFFDSIPTTVANFVISLLRLARHVGVLRSALTTLQRLVDRPALKTLDWPTLLDEAIAEDPHAWRDVRDMLVRTSLLSYEQIIDLLGRHDTVWQGAEEEPSFQSSVGWLARWALDEGATYINARRRSILEVWLQKAAPHASLNNYVLTSGIKFCPELVCDAALNWIQTRPRYFQTHYLMVAWLKQGLPTEPVAQSVAQWAYKFSTVSNLSFVAQAWLDAGGDIATLCVPIKAWLSERVTASEAQFVYKAWLDAGGDKEAVHPYMEAWLATHRTDIKAQFVYQAWLGAGGDKETVLPHVDMWLTQHAAAAEASFAYKAWLNAGGDTETVRPHIEAWLAQHAAVAEARFVYQPWLNAGGDTETVRPHIEAWLAQHAAVVEAGFVYKAWLDAGGDTETVRPHIEAWLAQHATAVEAGFVYKAWLDAGGDTETVRPHIEAWLAQHAAVAEARFVYKAWLNAGGDTETVRPHIEAWLAQHAAVVEAGFVYKAWLDASGDTETVRPRIEAWLAQHAAVAEAQFVYKPWLDAGGDTETVRPHIEAWLAQHAAVAEARFVYQPWLDAGGDTETIQESLMTWLDEHGDSTEADFVYKAWLESGGSFSVIRSHAIKWLSRNFDREEAVFLTKSLSKQKDIPVETVRDILSWCRKFPSNEDAFWRLGRLTKHLLIEEVAEEVCAASEGVLDWQLSTDNRRPPDSGQISILISYLIGTRALQKGEPRRRVDDLLLRWLRHPASFGDDPKPHANIQRRSYVSRVIELIDSGALSVTEDRDALERFMRWVNNWEPAEKAVLISAIDYLERRHPAEGLWDIVKFEDAGSATYPADRTSADGGRLEGNDE
jgi:DNA-nicking Smr family endonuclease